MRQTMILTGEINLKTVTDPTVPFGRVTKELGEADLVFANLESCSLIHRPHTPPTRRLSTRPAKASTPVPSRRGPEARWLRWRGMCQQRHVRRGRHSGVAGPAAGTRDTGDGRRPEPGGGAPGVDHREERRTFWFHAADVDFLAARPGCRSALTGRGHPGGAYGISAQGGEPRRRPTDHPDHGRRHGVGRIHRGAHRAPAAGRYPDLVAPLGSEGRGAAVPEADRPCGGRCRRRHHHGTRRSRHHAHRGHKDKPIFYGLGCFSLTRDTVAGTAPSRRSTGWACWPGSPLRTRRSSR